MPETVNALELKSFQDWTPRVRRLLRPSRCRVFWEIGQSAAPQSKMLPHTTKDGINAAPLTRKKVETADRETLTQLHVEIWCGERKNIDHVR